MEKKKLLITLGCSLTEGLGCYGDDITKEEIKSVSKGMIPEKYKKRFQEYGWPKILYNLLNYDELINLGKMGGSTSGNLKHFSESYLDKDFSDYEVLVIWQLPQASRVSFYMYRDWKRDYIIDDILLQDGTKLSEEITNRVVHPYEAGLREQVFYIKMFEQVCENNNWNLILLPTAIQTYKELNKLYPSKYFLSESFDWNEFPNHKEHISPVCHHPNEKGYNYIANKIYKIIEKDEKN